MKLKILWLILIDLIIAKLLLNLVFKLVKFYALKLSIPLFIQLTNPYIASKFL